MARHSPITLYTLQELFVFSSKEKIIEKETESGSRQKYLYQKLSLTVPVVCSISDMVTNTGGLTHPMCMPCVA